MLRTLIAITLAGAFLPAHALTAAEQLRLQRHDETNCGWVQTYTDLKIERCTMNKGEMLVVPHRQISRPQAIDLLADTAVAAEMNRKSPELLYIALSPAVQRYLRVKGNPVRFNGAENRKLAIQRLSKSAVECRVKGIEILCDGDSPTKAAPAN